MNGSHPESIAEIDDASWATLRYSIRRLETAWQAGTPDQLAPFVPACSHTLRLAVLTELIKVDQEHRWRRGERKRTEDYVREWPELGADETRFTELVRAECLTRAIFDATPTVAEIQARFPTIHDRIDWSQLTEEARSERQSSRNRQTATAASIGRDDVSLPLGRRFGRYEIRKLIGRGGMGAVYRAFDTELRREVALKIPNFDPATEPVVLERFIREACAAAAIRHPNVCPVYDVGQIEAVHYISMAFVKGHTLAAAIADRTISADAVDIVRKLALALDRIHSAGIIHRDIKPMNVMIDEHGEPLLMDFGLARQSELAGSVEKQLTTTGSLLGTPAYMSPEQVAGDATTFDCRSDIYSLGVLLYQLLTGQLPFTGPLTQVLMGIANTEPPTLRSIKPELDGKLEAVCLKAMAKRPENRYATAAEFAAALAESTARTQIASAAVRIVAPDRTQARSASEGKPPFRPRWRVGLLWAAAAILLLLGGVVIYVNTGEGALVLEVNEPDVQVLIDGRKVAIKSPRDTFQFSVRTGDHKLEVMKDGFVSVTEAFSIRRNGKVELTATLKATGVATTTSAASSPALAALMVKASELATDDPTDGPARSLRREYLDLLAAHRGTPLGIETARSMARIPWPVDALRRDEIPAYQLAVAGLGDSDKAAKKLVAILGDGRLQHWSDIRDVEFSPDGSLIASAGGSDATVAIWERATGELRHLLIGHTWVTHAVSFSPDGRTLASASEDGTVILWDVETGQEHARLPAGQRVRAVEFSPDREHLATRTLDGTVKLWKVKTDGDPRVIGSAREQRTERDSPSANLLAFNHDGTLLAAGGNDNTVMLWNVATGEERVFAGHSDWVGCVAFSPDGAILASGAGNEDGSIRLWNIATGDVMLETEHTTNHVLSLAFSPDGKTLASSNAGQTVRLWNTEALAELRSFTAPPSNWIWSVAFSPDGKELAGATGWHGIVLWDLASGQEVIALQHHRGAVTRTAFSPDGETLATASTDGTVRLWDVASGLELEVVGSHTEEVLSLAFSMDGNRLATGSRDSTGRIWDLTRRRAHRTLRSDHYSVVSIALTDDKKLAVSGNYDGTITVWDAGTGNEIKTVPGHSLDVMSIALSPDGKTLAAADRDGQVKLWDAVTWQVLLTTSGHARSANSVTFSPDGTVFASAGDDGAIKLWNASTVALQRTITPGSPERPQNLFCVAYSPDGSTLAVSCHDGTVRTFDARSGESKEVIRLGPPAGRIPHISFSPDGRHIATANANGTVFILRLESLSEARTRSK